MRTPRLLAVCFALGLAPRASPARAEDLFVVSDARLREAPSPAGKVLGIVRGGAHLSAFETRAGFVRVSRPGASGGWLAKETTALFGDGCTASREMLTVGRFLAADPSRRALATALLTRGTERLRGEGTRDGGAELLLAELLEAAGGAGAAAAFSRALDAAPEDGPLRDRARAGLLASRFPRTSEGLVALWSETAAWLELSESATDPAALSRAAPRLSRAALGLGRLLLAAGKPDELAALARRMETCATRLAAIPEAPFPRVDGAARLLHAMRGDGGASFPQAAAWGAGPAPLTARIDGELGALTLTLPGRAPIELPVLPVPGSLRIAPDGRSVAWLEVSAPATIVPMVVALAPAGAAGDAALLAGGRAGRDRNRKEHLLTRFAGFSPDGRRLLVSVAAWDDVPPLRPRLALLDARTSDLRWEGSGGRRREAEARLARRGNGRG